jgi:hypothetical protein
MRDIIKINFNEKDEVEGQRQMFAFAADDYRGATGRTAKKAIGGILEETDDSVSILEFISNGITNMSDLIIFDINHVSDKKVTEVRDLFRINQFGYSELKNVYEDRIVFGRNVIQ